MVNQSGSTLTCLTFILHVLSGLAEFETKHISGYDVIERLTPSGVVMRMQLMIKLFRTLFNSRVSWSDA